MSIKLLTPLKKKITIFSDLRKDLLRNPLSNDTVLFLDEEAVKESLKNLILTNKGERLFQPNIGSVVSKSLFELFTPATEEMVRTNVKDVINNYEPRVNLIDVKIVSNPDKNRLEITIYFYVRNSQNQLATTVYLERIR